MTYRKGYFKALLDVNNFMQILADGIKNHAERWKVAIAVIREVLVSGKLDYFMEQGGKVEFKYKYEKGKVTFVEVGEIRRARHD